MLEFIVLGQIPGTQIILSFSIIAIILVVIAVSAFVYYQLGFSLQPKLKRIQEIIEISL